MGRGTRVAVMTLGIAQRWGSYQGTGRGVDKRMKGGSLRYSPAGCCLEV